MKKLATIEGFDIFFQAETEHVNKKQHFMEECDWTLEQYKELKGTAWFCAHVEVRKAGIPLSNQYLGCCSYKTVSEFYTEYKDDYLKDMIAEGLNEAKKALPIEILRIKKAMGRTQKILTGLAA